MRIVIDLEAAQSPDSRNRGIGRYSMALARAMLRHGGGRHEFIVALNGMYADTVMPMREALEGLVPQTQIVTWHAALPARRAADAHERGAFEKVRRSFFDSLDADFVHVASLFEFGKYSFPSIGGTRSRVRTAVTLYDLIPHIYREIYLPNAGAAHDYDHKLNSLKRADLWLAISEATRRDAIERLALPEDRVVNISASAEAHFTPAVVPAAVEVDLRTRYGILKPFVMFTGGIEQRKNIERLIETWALLPTPLRDAHQLVIVCFARPDERSRLEQFADSAGLFPGELVLTGFVPDEHLANLYRLCKLFVFPSLYEGFGLPVLEAMRCGAPVIGSDNSSIPEVIGRPDALFDARSIDSMLQKLSQALADESFRLDLARFGLQQAERFSWDRSAKTALDAIERVGPGAATPPPRPQSRPRLAYVSPLPPQRSGIADYSAELIPALAKYYDIDVIVDQPEVDRSVLGHVGEIRQARWFAEHGAGYDRVLYHFGNSVFHLFMLPLLHQHPGTVVLHDFFLSGMQAHRELVTEKQPHWSRALYESHGWQALARRARGGDLTDVIHDFPANFEVLRDAQGVIVHSPFSCQLARAWYGPHADKNWRVVPLARALQPRRRDEARAELGLGPDDFLVCSFGILGPTKLSDRLLRCWQQSSLAADPHCQLVFVGENDDTAFGRTLRRAVETAKTPVTITGWASASLFRYYLDAADVAVQLRTLSRGESSAAVLDAMNHAVPVIANANGSMAYLPREAAIVLDDEFTDAELVAALERLHRESATRRAMGESGRRVIETRHSPSDCAAAYAEAIEAFSQVPERGPWPLVREVAAELPPSTGDDLLQAFARAIAHNEPGPTPARQVLIELAAWLAGDIHIPPLLEGMLNSTMAGWRFEPVYRAADGLWRYARGWMLRAAPGGGRQLIDDDVVEMRRCDVWGLPWGSSAIPPEARQEGLPAVELAPGGNAEMTWAYLAASLAPAHAARCYVDISEFMRHDWQSGISRVTKNHLFELLRRPPAGAVVVPVYAEASQHGYRSAMAFLRSLAGIPGTPDDPPDPYIQARAGDTFFGLDLQPHFTAYNHTYLKELREAGVRIVFMVHDLLPIRLPDCFVPDAAIHHERWLRVVADAHLVICVSQATADDLLRWLEANQEGAPLPQIRHVHNGADLGARLIANPLPEDAAAVLARLREQPCLLMVGTIEPRKCHAEVLSAFEHLWAQGSAATLVIVGRPGWMTETLIQQLRAHPEQGKRLQWISEAGDEYLEALYRTCSGLILASRGEGFGLPLVEAAQRGLPIVARDLPVFRELAGDHAFYFNDDQPAALASSIAHWLSLCEQGVHPESRGIAWLSWTQSTARLRRLLESWDQVSV